MAHHEKNIFGVQFHPEVSGLQGSLLIENFYKICQK
jgi:imidazoleglycerol phosphate synthase glutamine amidotransferase subunit HisH